MNEVVPVKMDGAVEIPAPDAAPSAQILQPTIIHHHPTRRDVLGGALKLTAAAGLAGAGIYAKETLDPVEHKLALLKMDKNHNLALIHRTLSLGEDNAMLETARTSIGGLSERTVDVSGNESMILSPDFTFRPKDNLNDPHNIDSSPLTISNAPKNLYIPYHLLDHAASMSIRREGRKVVLSIDTLPEAKDADKAMVEIENAKLYAAHQAAMVQYQASLLAHNTKQGAEGFADNTLDYIGNPFGWGKDEPKPSAAPTPPAEPHYLKPGEVTGHFSIAFDALPNENELPDIHFYNGFTLATPSFTLKREDIDKALNSKDHAYTLLHSTPTGKVDENNNPIYKRHFEPERFAHEVEAASTCRECSVKDGIVYKVWDAAKETFIEDNSIPKSELGALQMGLHFQQGKIEARGEGSWRQNPSEAIEWVKKHAVLTGLTEDPTPGR